MVKLTEEQRTALQENPEGVLCQDDATNRVYCLVDRELHEKAMRALKQQQDLDAIRRGVAEMQSSDGTPLNEARAELAKELGFENQS